MRCFQLESIDRLPPPPGEGEQQEQDEGSGDEEDDGPEQITLDV